MKITYAILIFVFLVSGCVQTSYEQDISEVQCLAIQGDSSAQADLLGARTLRHFRKLSEPEAWFFQLVGSRFPTLGTVL